MSDFFSKNKMLLGGIAGTLVGMIACEHVAKKLELEHKPSTLISSVSKKSYDTWKRVGGFVVWVSSFYTCVDLKDFGETIQDLTSSLAKLCMSPIGLFTGYYKSLNLDQYRNKLLIVLGTCTLVGGGCFIASRRSNATVVSKWENFLVHPFLVSLFGNKTVTASVGSVLPTSQKN